MSKEDLQLFLINLASERTLRQVLGRTIHVETLNIRFTEKITEADKGQKAVFLRTDGGHLVKVSYPKQRSLTTGGQLCPSFRYAVSGGGEEAFFNEKAEIETC